jgi:hypothetical protein
LEIVDGHLVYFVVIWYISRRFGILYQEKSGNPASNCICSRIFESIVFFDYQADHPFLTQTLNVNVKIDMNWI